jgi:Flp pilus assembly protein TadB
MAAFVFSIPWGVPLLVGGATLCGLYSIKLKYETTVFDQKARDAPWKREVIQFVRRAAKIPQVAAVIGPPDMEELISSAGRPRNITANDVDLLRALSVLLAVTGLIFGLFGGKIALLVLVLLLKAPEWVLLTLARKRNREMSRNFIPMAARLAGALSAGMETTKALEWAAKNDSSPLAEEMNYALNRARAGASLPQALGELAKRTGLLEARRVATALKQAQTHGVPVSETLMATVRDARERRQNEAAGKAQVAEQKMQMAVLLMALPTIIWTLAALMISMSFQAGGI